MQNKSILFSLLVTVAACAGCASDDTNTDLAGKTEAGVFSNEQKQLADIETGRLGYRLISDVVSCTGEIEVPPEGIASVTAPLGAYIASTDMVPGRYVKKGQLLASLANPEYIVLQQSYLETVGQLKFAEQDFQRQKMLQEQNATAEKKLQESESAFLVLKARRAGLRARLKLVGISLTDLDKGIIQDVVTLRAPISGYITEVNHHPGEFVEPREAIFEIVDMSELHLHLNLFEQDISKVNIGQRIQFRPTGGGGGLYQGEVSLVSPKRNADARSFDVHGHITTGEKLLKPGMHVEADILMSADSLPAVPQGAIVYRNGQGFVITEMDGKFSLQAVETGVKMEGWVEIINPGALDQKTIVVGGASRVFAAMQR